MKIINDKTTESRILREARLDVEINDREELKQNSGGSKYRIEFTQSPR